MHYEPVKIHTLYQAVINRKTGTTRIGPNYFQVRTKTETCGHKHKTHSAAIPCLNRMKMVWHNWRSAQSKQAALARKGA